MLIVLLTSAAGVAFAVNRYTKSQEDNEFKEQFEIFSNKAIEAIRDNLEKQLSTLERFSLSVTTEARATGQKWPFVTVSDFEGRARLAMSQVNALSLLIYQLVPSNQRQAWKDYTAKNAGWKQDGIDFQLAGGYSENSIVAPPVQAVGVPPLDFSSGIANDIYTFNERFENVVDESPGPWLPLWQNAPALAAMNSENANGLSLIGNEKGFEEALQHRKASLGLTSGADPTVFDPVTWIVTVLLQVWGRSANDNEPIGYLFYPIIDDHEESSPVVGVFSMFLHWGGLFVNLLPEDAVGVLAVFENTCNQKFTYRVDGSRARNLGLGDLHNPKYNGLVKSIDVTSFFNGRQNSTYSGVPLSDGFCAYSVSIYPSEETENKYKTNAPFLYTISVVMIFVFTTIIFIMYDLIVEFRQRLVMRNALKTGAIVSDLFPDAIRERLMKDASSKKTRGSKSHYTSKKGLIKSFLSDDLEESSEEQPLADLFRKFSDFGLKKVMRSDYTHTLGFLFLQPMPLSCLLI